MVTGTCCCICVQTSEVGVVERFGQFEKLAKPGLSLVFWPLSQVVGTISTRVQQLDVQAETKTSDNVFITVNVCVQYQVLYDKVYDAFYRLTDPKSQIRSYVYDVIRSTMPKLELDQAFAAKEEVAHAVKEQLTVVMQEYGYQILQALVTDLEPDRRVKDAMNEINASKRLREAATNKAEADKIMQVKAAEAEAESKYLSGVGVSRQRQAIVAGLRDSIHDFSSSIEGTTPKDVMDLLLLTQYFDMLRDIGQSTKSSTIFLPHAPESVASLQGAMRDGFMQAAAAKAQTINRA
ncbi:flagellar associated protein [Tribonema minus]|uniref:Flagellar associated protein n=1 Tax=Tribonema minus TaxID=303371 RepID=A0A835YL74_9STRA|nr:flagellar associated protein [Tribonema minus]